MEFNAIGHGGRVRGIIPTRRKSPGLTRHAVTRWVEIQRVCQLGPAFGDESGDNGDFLQSFEKADKIKPPVQWGPAFHFCARARVRTVRAIQVALTVDGGCPSATRWSASAACPSPSAVQRE